MTPKRRPAASASSLSRAVRARTRRVGGGVAWRVGFAGTLLAGLLVATSWLVSPAPQVDDTYLRFLAISTTCEMLLWFAIVLITRRVFVASALFALAVGAVIITNNLKYEYTAVAALPIDAYAAIGVMYDLSTFTGYIGDHIAEAVGLAVLCGLVGLGFLGSSHKCMHDLAPGRSASAVGRRCGCARARYAAVQSSVAQLTAACAGPALGGGPARRQPDQTQAADSMALTWRRTVKDSGTRPRLSPMFCAGAERSLTVQPPWNGQSVTIPVSGVAGLSGSPQLLSRYRRCSLVT